MCLLTSQLFQKYWRTPTWIIDRNRPCQSWRGFDPWEVTVVCISWPKEMFFAWALRERAHRLFEKLISHHQMPLRSSAFALTPQKLDHLYGFVLKWSFVNLCSITRGKDCDINNIWTSLKHIEAGLHLEVLETGTSKITATVLRIRLELVFQLLKMACFFSDNNVSID